MSDFIHHYLGLEDVREMIQLCSDKNHVQQVAYSTYHDALTQICFSCEHVVTSMDREDLE